MIPSFPQGGGCSCGDVRYRLLADPVMFYACHCTDCQTATGSAFGLSMVCQAEHVELVRGRPVLVEVALPRGRLIGAQHCPRCRVSVWGESRALPNLRNLRPGGLDDTSWVDLVRGFAVDTEATMERLVRDVNWTQNQMNHGSAEFRWIRC